MDGRALGVDIETCARLITLLPVWSSISDTSIFLSLTNLSQAHDISDDIICSPETVTQIIENAIAHLSGFAPFFHRPTRSINALPLELCAGFLLIGLLISRETEVHDLGCSMLTALRASVLRLVS